LISQRKEEEEEEEREEEDFLEGEEGLSAAAKRAPSGRAAGDGIRPGANSPAAMRRRFAAMMSARIEPSNPRPSFLLLTF
jgi:hypothetical protein